MKKELVQQLKERYPLIFSEVGVECGDGWYTIIDRLCSNIQGHINWKPENCSQVVAEQVKEKFGGLRFYHRGGIGNGTIDGLVTMAEAMSEVTCEVCGNLGKRRDGGWIKTLCDTHHEEREAMRAGNGTP